MLSGSSAGGAAEAIAVIGLGMVGLPLAMQAVRAGCCVCGVDRDMARLEGVRAGRSFTPDVEEAELAAALASGRLQLQAGFPLPAACRAALVCVPARVLEGGQPDFDPLLTVAQACAAQPELRLFVIETSVPPGTVRNRVAPIFAASGRAGRGVHLAYSPERIDPGHTREHGAGVPKLVGGLTPEATIAAVALYRQLGFSVVPTPTIEVAETAKLFENAHRLVNIALVNELALICDQLQIDVWDVLAAAATKPFGYTPFRPGAGAGGPCVPEIPQLLAWASARAGRPADLLQAAVSVNERMPAEVVARLERVLRRQGRSLAGARILAVGVTYKPDVPDIRRSAALEVFHHLRRAAAEAQYVDPLVPSLLLDGEEVAAVDLSQVEVEAFDGVVLLVPHRTLDLPALAARAQLVLDVPNALDWPPSERYQRL